MILSLNDFLRGISINTKAHICIHDISGFTSNEPFKIPVSRVIHSSKICDTAKSSKQGMKLCFACKALATKTAVSKKCIFSGICHAGITEIVCPIVYNDEVCGNIYIGNIIADEKIFRENAERISKITKIDCQKYINCIESAELCKNPQKYEALAKTVNSYIHMLFKIYGFQTSAHRHWIADSFAQYINKYCGYDISIGKLAGLYGVNEKYAGRVFKAQMKESFNSYLNKTRVKYASSLLETTSMSIIDISLESGFNNVTYFNRVFKSINGLSPKKYRKNFSETNVTKTIK